MMSCFLSAAFRKAFWTVLLLLVALFRAEAKHFQGSISRVVPEKWQDGFVSGNGRMGSVLFGSPGNETLAVNHCRLYIPAGKREIVPDLAAYLPEVRQKISASGDKPWIGAKEAIELLEEKSREQGHEGFPSDSFHPGMFVEIRQELKGEGQGLRAHAEL
jgi:alpha-L-fucosidase 2